VEVALGFLHINFVAQDSFTRVVPSKVVDQVEKTEDGVAKCDPREFFFSDSLIGGLAFLPVEREVMGDSLLWNDVAVFVDGELVLAAHGVDFRLLHLLDGVDGEGNAVAQFHILTHQLLTTGRCLSLSADLWFSCSIDV
jgi:hypothetical protein